MTQMHPNLTPRLPDSELLPYVKQFQELGRRTLALLADHPSPLYVLDRPALRERARSFRAAWSDALGDLGFFYAVKSNNHPEVARTLVAAGFGLDVSSGRELQLALDAGAAEIVFSGPGKTLDELRLAVAHADELTVLVDSFGELERLEAVATEAGRQVTAGVRLTTNPVGLWRKFGIPLDALPHFWNTACQGRHVRLEGLQFHTSWNLNAQAHTDFIAELGAALRQAPASLRSALRFIDLGGGYWPERGEWLQLAGTPEGARRAAAGEPVIDPSAHFRLPALPIRDMAAAIGGAVRTHLAGLQGLSDCRYCVEPGRWICNDAMHLLFTVVDKKAPDLVITDAGTNAVGWERFETDYFPVINLTRPAMTEHPCHVLGSLCTPHDVWGYSYFGRDIQEGDVLLVPTQGAYTYSLQQHFIKPLPAVVCL